MLHIHHGNRLEALADALCERLRTPVGGPLEPEVVVVGSAGMARWVSLAVAQRLGIAANLDCPFPAAFIARVLDAQWPGRGHAAGFDREVLALRVLALLPELAPRRGFEPVRRYLRAGGQAPPAQHAWQLAQRIAQCLDRYQLYRPQWLLAWEAGEEDHWQARLWRALTASAPGPHRARLYADYLTLAPGEQVTDGLPARLSVFGLAALAPAHLAVLRALARVCEVAVYFPNPCAQYWGDVQSERAQARVRSRTGAAPGYAGSGHPLLASLGAPARDFLDQLLGCDEADWHEHFASPAGASLLARVQRDVLELAAPQAAPVDAADGSITFHVCHSPLREVQVLHDALLGWFAADPTLEPRHIAVMVPDPEAYAPHFAAVFGAAPAGRQIPWALADRAAAAGHPLVARALGLLDLPDSRLPATEVEAWLELPAVRAALGLPDEALPVLRRWVADSGARFGYDAAGRARAGLPAERAHTWRFGLDRLLLAHATPDVAVGEVAPLPALAAGDVAWAGALAELARRLDELARTLAGPHTPARWAQLLHGALAALFEPTGPEDHDALDAVRGAIAQCEELAARAGWQGPLERAVLRAQMADALARRGPARAFLTGAVTCCALTPMRAVPFRRVCVLGLDDDFTRRAPPADFDLMARARQGGDPVPREEARALFLDALLGAREALYLSWVGREARDNSPRPPAVVVGELLDLLRVMAGAPAVAARITEHPLQPFSVRYGQPGGPRTFAAQWFAPAPGARAFCAGALPAGPVPAIATLAELAGVLCRPARSFLAARLGVRLPRAEQALLDDEPFVLEGLDEYRLRARAIEAHLRGEEGAAVCADWARTGALPGGAVGRALFDALWEQAGAFAAGVRAIGGASRPDQDVALTLPGGATLHGRIGGRMDAGLVRWRPAGLKGTDALKVWVDHLAACAGGAAQPAWHIGKDGDHTLRLVPLAPARALATLADLHALATGLQAQALPFLPQCAWAYAQCADEPDKAIAKAREAWRGSAFQEGRPPAESEDEDVALVFRGRDPVEEPEFEALALAVYGPLLAACGGGMGDGALPGEGLAGAEPAP